MPYKEKETEKIYWSIKEVSDIMQVPQSMLRFWEKEFDSIRPKKNKKGDRFYKKEDIEHLKRIQHLLKEKGYTIRGAREKLKVNTHNSESQYQTIETLKKLKDFLLTLREQL